MNILISYYSSHGYDFRESIRSLKRSVEKYSSVDKIIIYTSKDIDPVFYKRHKKILKQQRGAGFWLWKPYIIQKTLRSMNEGDKLFYCDAGLEFIQDPGWLFDLASPEQPIVLFRSHDWTNQQLTKIETYKIMQCDPDVYKGYEQVIASYQVYCKNYFTVEFAKQFLLYAETEMCINDDHLGLWPNDPVFIDHRHDQSILSLLSVKYGLETFRDPSQYGNGILFNNSQYPQVIQKHGKRSPFFLTRLQHRARKILKYVSNKKGRY